MEPLSPATVFRVSTNSVQNIGSVDLSRYIPAHSSSYYGDIKICETGSMRPAQPLSEAMKAVLSSIDADIPLWNGSRGILGRAYDTPRSFNLAAQQQSLNTDQVGALRAKYIELQRGSRLTKTRRELQKELSTKRKLHVQLVEAVDSLEGEMQALRRRSNESVGHGGRVEKELNCWKEGLEQMLDRTHKNLWRTKEAMEVLKLKMVDTQGALAEVEGRFLQRLAILQRLFIDGGREWERLDGEFGGEGEMVVRMAKSAERKCGECWTRNIRAKQFYVDAKLGLRHLYQVESGLKGVLEHLWEAMQSHKGVGEGLPSVVGVDYRLGYVRKQWGEVEKGMREGMKYLRATSLKGDEERMKKGFLGKMSWGCGLKREERIRGLYELGREGYSWVSGVFDEQEKWVERALEEVRRTEAEEIEEYERLLGLWERLLGIQN